MLQHRVAEVVVEVAVDAMDVIGAILRVVVLNQERRALNEIMVRLAGLETAGPWIFSVPARWMRAKS